MNDVALRANGHALGVIWRETLEMFTDLWYNGAKQTHQSTLQRRVQNEKDIVYYC